MDTLDQAVATLAPTVGTVRACRAVGQPRSSWYRRHRQSPPPSRPPRPAPAPHPRALQAAERQQVLDVLHQERFWDTAPASVYATLLDEGVYLASVSTMYRLLREAGETGDRRRHATYPPRSSPSCWPAGPTSAGRGTSPSWPGRPGGRGSTCM
jgi:putative transposase